MVIRLTLHSYKGGAGKTTIATNMANQLSIEGYKTLLIETDYLMPVYHGIFAEIKPTRFFNEIYERKSTSLKELIYSHSKNLDIIFANPNFQPEDPIFRMDQEQFGMKINHLIKSINDIQESYEYILYDTSPGWNFPLIGNLITSDIVIVVLRPNIYEVRGTVRLVRELYRKARLTRELRIYALFNQIPDVEQGHRFKEWKETILKENIEIIGEIKCSCELSRDLGWGITLVPRNNFLYNNIKLIISRL